mmetsp:Transcript_9578/g.13075  ORF Transcript_9578/g.13075 Transcript_9578/m.13075 type:complete len:80 (-) Transcript_9578:649-888(-)|eukprot:CAMPEP_0185590772 /NCGR_PEP_ID=MMETSP0434-20130131/62010_1 /TAXON_ID=626734 ORGANISM="Favella taraikaensis, Strain Fe Narragansett Bay" /NCGR_SAMPLE_ID=MMETSP0434 /ASSEMBLY_ACC=CAM_ASM_000379 /LENGTH=79 /DNA_ID=CAMNT_0028215231 /DNA_START=213 /DNA_END=452 /DNA_ORIENTATION=+
MNVFTAVLTTMLTLIVACTFREKPGAPICSRESPAEEAEEQLPLIEQLKISAGNKEFLFTSFGTSLILVNLFVFSSFMN